MRLEALLAGALLGGCAQQAPTTLDGSSAEGFVRTSKAARDDLPVADRLTFDRAIATVPARRYANRDPSAAARVVFDGMTAAEIVATERQRTKGKL